MRKYGSYRKAGMRFARQSRRNSVSSSHRNKGLQVSDKDVNTFAWFVMVFGFIAIMIIIIN